MDRCSWTFGRGAQRLILHRESVDGPPRLVVAKDQDPPRTYHFDDVEALMHFQTDMEQFLVHTGWSLIEFAPERRTYRDRRSFPRLSDRRRWWTDAVVAINRSLRERG